MFIYIFMLVVVKERWKSEEEGPQAPGKDIQMILG